MAEKLRAPLGLALAIALAIGWVAWRERAPGAREGERPRAGDGAPSATEEPATPLAGTAPAPTPARAPSAAPSSIRGRVRMVDGAPCASGHVFAWRVGIVPRAEDFAGARASGRVQSAAIGPDGSFEVEGLDPLARYTLGAAVLGAALAERPSDLRPGRAGVELRLSYLLGVAVVLEDARGGPPRTAARFFGSGPLATGPAPKLLEPPPELAALAIAGLDPGRGSRDRWPYLVLSAEPAAELGPIDYRVQVPGYRRAEARLAARPVLGRLHEERVLLEPVVDSWGEIAVELEGAPVARGLELSTDELVGAVRLVRAGDEPWDVRTVRFAVHARALLAPEPIGALPTGDYEAVFEAEDSGYETDPARLTVTEGRQSLTFDLADSGLLLLDLRTGPTPHDGRCALRIDDARGGHFYATFDRGPYLVPFLVPGSYRLTEIDAPGCTAVAPSTPFDVFAGELTVEIAECEDAVGADPRR